MAKNKTKESTVLITRFSALGDVVISVPVVYDVCRAHPDVQFVMLTRPWPAQTLLQRPANLTVESVDLALQAVKAMLIAAVQIAAARKTKIIRFIVVFSLMIVKIPSHCIVCKSLWFMYLQGPYTPINRKIPPRVTPSGKFYKFFSGPASRRRRPGCSRSRRPRHRMPGR